MNVADIKAKFPNPSDPLDDQKTETSYCVGGAFCMALGWKSNTFPNVDILMEALREANADLSIRLADKYAVDIIKANDAGDYEAAWKALGDALEYKP